VALSLMTIIWRILEKLGAICLRIIEGLSVIGRALSPREVGEISKAVSTLVFAAFVGIGCWLYSLTKLETNLVGAFTAIVVIGGFGLVTAYFVHKDREDSQ